MVLGLRRARRTAVLTALTAVLVVLLPLSNINVNNALLQPQSVFAQEQGGGNESGGGPLGGLTEPSQDLSNQPGTTTIINQTLGNLSTYNSPSLGIEFLYPTQWLNVTQIFANSIAIIQYISPPDNQTNFGAVLNIAAEKLSNVTTLEEYVKSNDELLNSTLNSYNVV
jgi:hypothetical protein